jgi:hypothetical protein
MTALVWHEVGKKFFHTGISKGVLFVQKADGSYEDGVAWNGLSSLQESPSGGESNKVYADNAPFLNLTSQEEWNGTLEAYMYPDEWAVCDGQVEPTPGLLLNQQGRKSFGLVWVSQLGNDVDGVDHGQLIHILWNAKASPSDRASESINENVEPSPMSWEISSTKVAVEGYKPLSTITVNTKTIGETELALLLTDLFGSESTEPTLKTPDEVIEMLTPAG